VSAVNLNARPPCPDCGTELYNRDNDDGSWDRVEKATGIRHASFRCVKVLAAQLAAERLKTKGLMAALSSVVSAWDVSESRNAGGFALARARDVLAEFPEET
jgi:hypothetical protein